MAGNEQIHKEHRQRLRKRYREEGLEGFNDIQVLELLLFYCIPRKDTNPVAHELLKHFGGSLPRVFEATVEELMEVDGIGQEAATFLSLVTAVGRYYQLSTQKNVKILKDIDACGDYMLPYFYGAADERVFLLCLDSNCKVICCKEAGEGSVNSASISVRRVVELALNAKASAVVLAHNHPSGIAIPSGEDIKTTRQLASALDAVDVTLVDHLVVADGDYVSIAQSGFYHPSDCRLRV